MPIIKSAVKRVRVAKKAAIRNLRTKRNLKSAIKDVEKAVDSKKSAEAEMKKAQSAIDTAVKKGVIHKNKAARKKAQLAKKAKATTKVSAKATKKTPAKKPVAKKAPAKKAPTKKVTKK